MAPLTPADIARLRELERAATAGPWSIDEDSAGNDISGMDANGKELAIIVTDNGWYPPRDGDAALIVAARNALPELLVAATALREIGHVLYGYFERGAYTPHSALLTIRTLIGAGPGPPTAPPE